MPTYRPRVIDVQLSHALAHPGAVVLEGARACGKSATGREFANSSIQFDTDPAALQLAELDPARLLDGARPRFIDEWQLAPAVWNQVRSAVDTQDDGSFILAGSAVPADNVTRHSGAGRMLRLRMRPMALSESGHSSAEISVGGVFDDPANRVSGASALSVSDLIEVAARGGWPGLQSLPLAQALDRTRAYLDGVTRIDLPRLDSEPRRDPAGVMRIIRALGRNVATEVAVAALARDASAGGEQMTNATAQGYLDALARVFVLEEQPSWGPHLRSRDRVRKAAKRHFVDPSLAVAAVGANADRLLRDLDYFGQVFESLVVRDLRVYADVHDAIVHHYRDSAGRDVDAIIERRDGSWIAVEVKLAASREEDAAASLKRFAANLDTARTEPPSAMMIITGGQYGYTRADGIHVIPIGALAA
ncbi:ATP-binding protein [Microbacterium profundi]|uniref:ATP-binding protein n=1 Tax=Microbacterium profundi TaxID=450380 RepID=UPI003F4F3916